MCARCLSATEALLQAGADLWACNAAGQVLLHVAAATGRVELFRLLLGMLRDCGAPGQALRLRMGTVPRLRRIPAPALERLVDLAGRTPLHAAAAKQRKSLPGKPALLSSWQNECECHFELDWGPARLKHGFRRL